MVDLRKRFGTLVAAHRRRQGMTQQVLADLAGLSPTMIVRIEGGSSGARFPNIEKIAQALEVDPGDLFIVGSNKRGRTRSMIADIDARLTGLSDHDLKWVDELLELALRRLG